MKEEQHPVLSPQSQVLSEGWVKKLGHLNVKKSIKQYKAIKVLMSI